MRNLQDNPFHGVIKEYKHWIVLFRERQVTIGSVIIMSKQLDQTSLGGISVEGWAQFGEVCHDVEKMITTAFGAEKFNYLALMMYDPEVHFHVIPRYSTPVRFEGTEYIDPDWPNATKRAAMNIDKDILRQIHNKLLSSI